MGYFGNPASNFHAMGSLAFHAVSGARAQVAAMLGVNFEDVFFTSSATESNNLVLRGIVENPERLRNKIIYGATEHASVVTTARVLEKNFGKFLGVQSAQLRVNEQGQVDLDDARQIIDSNTLCVCLMDVNNETGILQTNLPEVISIAHSYGVPVHIDAVQGFARGEFLSKSLDWDSITLSAGKIYGPRGAALLAVRRRSPRIRIEPQLTGGGQEFGMRSSTVNVAGVVGFAKAMELQECERSLRNAHLRNVESTFLRELESHVEFRTIGCGALRAPGIVSLLIDSVNPLKLVEDMKQVAVGVGSACRSLHASASHVLLAMGLPLDESLSTFRVSFGLPTTENDACEGAKLIAQAVQKFRN